MTFLIQPLKGIFKPLNYSYQLRDAEGFKGYKRYIVVFFFLSIIVFLCGAVLGIGSSSLSKELSKVSGAEFETKKQLLLIGRILLGVTITAIVLFASSLFYWSIFDISYRKLVIIQMTIFCIYLLEKIVQIPLFVLLDIHTTSNVFSLGIIAQYLTQKEWVIHLLSQITVFQVCMIFLTYYYIAFLTDRKKIVIGISIAFLYVLYWAISGGLSLLRVSIFL